MSTASFCLLALAAALHFRGGGGLLEGWRPVGRGDPLRDPTHEYMPPVLDRVRYWPTMAPPPPPLMLVPPPPAPVVVETLPSYTPLSLQSLLLREREPPPRPPPPPPPPLPPPSTTTTTTTTAAPLTTPNPLRYRHPPPPPPAPVYTIIQGHSKVKKYGAGKADPVSGIYLRQDTNQVADRRS